MLAVAVLALFGSSLYMRAGTDAQVAQAENLPTISTGNVEVLRGKYFTVDIILSDNTLGLTSLEIGLDYDPTVMTLVAYDTRKVLRGSALPSLGFNTSNFDATEGMNVRPVRFIWNGTDPDYSNGTIVTLRFKSISSSDENLLGKHYFTLTYKQSNTFRTTPKAEGGNIIYQEVNLDPGYVDVTAGKFQCTYFDWDGSEIIHYEENDFSLFVPEEPAHPSRASTRTHYFTYEEDQWDAENPWTEDMEEPESINWDITALYTAHAQPYTVYYYFGEKDPETGVITMGETAEDYYYTWDTTGETPVKVYCEPKTSVFGGTIILPAQYTEAFYSLSPWYTNIACTEELLVGLIPEDTSVSAATVADLPVGEAAPADTFKLKLYAYRQQNNDIVPPEELDVNASRIENVVTVADTLAGPVVTVDITLTKNFGIMSMLLTLDYDRTCLTLTNVARGAAFPSNIFTHTNIDGVPEKYSADPYILYWENSSGNYYGTGVIATLTFTLDPDASVGDHLITLTYTPKQDVTRYYDNTIISGSPAPAMLWYTTVNVVDGYVTLREVTAPTAHEGNYYFNKTEQTYTFATNGDIAEYDIITSITRTLHGSQPVTVSLKKNDNVYRFWQAAEGRPRTDISFTFEILKRSVAIPQASSATYTYNHAAQTYTFDDVGGAGYYTATDNFTRTIVGSQTITCKLDYPEETYWGEDQGDTADKDYVFTIRRLRVTAPVPEEQTYVYDTTEQTYAFSTFDTAQTYYTMPEGADKRTISGEQTITVSLKNTDNYCWNEAGDPTAAKTFKFEILKRSITVPTAHVGTYIYTGIEQTYTFNTEAQENKERYYSVSGNKQTNAGTYTGEDAVTVTLLHKEHTYWGSDKTDVADKTFDFVIDKATVTPPTASTQSLTFDVDVSTGNAVAQTYVFAAEPGDNTLYTVDTDAMTKSDSGTTYIGVTLDDQDNYKWSTTGLSAALSYPFTIAKKAVVQPLPNTAFTDDFVYTGSPISYVLKNKDDRKFYTVTNDERTNAGTYTGTNAVTVTLKHSAHSYWAGSDPQSSAALAYDFVIAKQQVDKPTAHSGEYRYTGEEQTYTFASAGGVSYYTVSGNKRTNAGSQTVTVTLGDYKANYAWKPTGTEGVSSDDLEFTFEILPQRVSVPQNKIEQGSPKTYTFTGSPIQAEFNTALQTDLYDVAGDVQTSSGTHSITFTLKLNTEQQKNYCWSDDTFAAKSIDFVIGKRSVVKPTYDPTVFTYTGALQTYTIGNTTDSAWYETSGTTRTDAGSQTVTVALKYKGDTYWKNTEENTDDIEWTFTIDKKKVAIISVGNKTYDGTHKTSGITSTADYTVNSDEGGVHAGTYDLVVTLNNANYKWSDEVETLERTFTYKIEKTNNSWTVAPSVSDWVYGESTTAVAAAEHGDVVITYHASGSSTYSSNPPVNVGNYAAKFYVAPTGDWDGLGVEGYEIEIGFQITRATLDMSDVHWDYTAPFTYGGDSHTVSLADLPSQFTDKPEVFYVTYENATNTARGDYTASATIYYDSANYFPIVDEMELDYKILPREVTVVWTKAASYVFTGGTFDKPTAKYVDINEEDVVLTVTEQDGKAFRDSGNYTFLATIADANYVAKEGTDSTGVEVGRMAVAAPAAHVGTYAYTGSEQTYTFASGFNETWMTASNDKRKNVGSQNVTVDLKDTTNTYWAGTNYSVAALTNYTFTIDKAEVIAPTTDTTKTYTFDGTAQTYAFASTEGVDVYYTVNNDKRTDAGEYKDENAVTVTLIDSANYRWKGTNSSAPLTFTFTIAKLAVTAPTEDETNYVYDGNPKTYTFKNAGDGAWYTASNKTRTDAGEQQVTVALKSKTNTYWKDAEAGKETADLPFTFTIDKAEVIAPTADTTAFTYTGAVQTYTLGNTTNSARYNVTNDQRTDAGEYKDENAVTVTLKDSANYRWKGTSSSAPLTFTFTIAKRAVTMPTAGAAYVYDGTSKTYTLGNTTDSAWYTLSGITTQTDAGSQPLTVALKNKTNTYWKDAEAGKETADLTFTFTIAKAEVIAPTADTTAFTYTGAEQTYTLGNTTDSARYNVTNTQRTNAGVYTGENAVTVTLKDSANYCWKGTSSSAPLTFTFSIAPVKVAKPAQDETKFFCSGSGSEQTYTVEPSPYYNVSGTKKSEHGTTYVEITLKNAGNYVWDDPTAEDPSAALLYPFVIEHNFERDPQNAHKKEDPTCEHGTVYYKVCVCGEVSTEETYEADDRLKHEYTVTIPFDWGEPETVDGVDSYSEVYATAVCSRCHHEERVLADLTLDVVLPGKAKGSKTYIATATFEGRPYTDTKVVELAALYHNYGAPVFTWTESGDATPTVVATFPCIDEGAEHLKIEVPATVTVVEKGALSFEYVATAYLYEKPYEERKTMAKPALTFIWNDDESVVYYVLPGQDVTDLIPAVPEDKLDVFLKWWDKEASISLVYVETDEGTAYTPFEMRNADRTFVAMWKSVGQITVAVSDVNDGAFKGCIVELKQGDVVIDTKTTGEDGEVAFNELEYGNYSVVVTYTDGTTVTYTTGTVLGESEKTVPVKMSEKRFNTEIKDETGKNVSVENLENTVPDEDKQHIFTAGQEGDVAEITVVLSVITETDAQVVEEMTEWIRANNNEVLDLSDITLVKTVKIFDGSGEEVLQPPTNIESSDVLVDITFPITQEIYSALAAVHGSVENVVVAKKDGENVAFMTKHIEEVALASEEECFYVKEEDGVPYIVVRTKTFSTAYGLCVNALSVAADNAIETFNVTGWTYGETPVPVTATATYGEPVIYYQINGEWVTTAPTNAGTYNVRAVVEKTTEYQGAEAGKQLTIAKATYNATIVFEDVTVPYDGEVHSVIATGVPEGVTVNYDNNGQVDVGEYLVTATFVVGQNYEPIAAMTATLRITGEDEGCCKSLWFWILIIIAIVETILFILFFLRGNKYKKKYDALKDEESMPLALLGLSPTACLAICIALAVLDVILLGLWIWALARLLSYKKKYEELQKDSTGAESTPEEAPESSEESAESEEAPSETDE